MEKTFCVTLQTAVGEILFLIEQMHKRSSSTLQDFDDIQF